MASHLCVLVTHLESYVGVERKEGPEWVTCCSQHQPTTPPVISEPLSAKEGDRRDLRDEQHVAHRLTLELFTYTHKDGDVSATPRCLLHDGKNMQNKVNIIVP